MINERPLRGPLFYVSTSRDFGAAALSVGILDTIGPLESFRQILETFHLFPVGIDDGFHLLALQQSTPLILSP